MSSVAVIPSGTKPALVPGAGSALRDRIEAALGERLSSTLLLHERAAPRTVSTGIAELDALTGGLPRGALSEITGPASSGRTGVMLAALAAATRRQEVCALVDASDSFDPASAAAAGVDLERLLWVRCHQHSASRRKREAQGLRAAIPSFAFAEVLEQVLKVTDLLLQGGGFGMVVLDLGDVAAESARRVPLTSWFRFRRAVEPTATVLLLIEQEPCAKTCASLVLKLRPEAICASQAAGSAVEEHLGRGFSAGYAISQSGSLYEVRKREDLQNLEGHCPPDVPENNAVSHAALLRGMRFHAEVLRSWSQRRPPRSGGAVFELRKASC